MPNEKAYRLAMNLMPGIGPKTIKQLISHCGSAESVFRTSKKQLLKIPGVGEKNVGQLLAPAGAIAEAERELHEAQKQGCEILFYTDDAFPKRLNGLYDAPALLYYRGNADLNSAKVISIVGTRNATEYGKRLTRQIIEGLQQIENLIIVSGLAYGIDIHAHRGALEFGIPTVGVMASGIDIVYPARHKATATQMGESGGLITEEMIGTKPEAHRFPSRNRIIAGMADCTLVVEGAIKGGALITARIANSYNREVFAIPGNVTNTYSAGCNFLIQNHEAHLVTGSEDVCRLMNWETEGKAVVPKDYTHLSAIEKAVIAQLQEKPVEIDELAHLTAIPMHELSALLLQLELQQLVTLLPGKKYALL